MIDQLTDVPVLATLREAAKFLRLSERKVWEMGRKGEIRVERMGRSVRYRLREFVAQGQVVNGQRD